MTSLTHNRRWLAALAVGSAAWAALPVATAADLGMPPPAQRAAQGIGPASAKALPAAFPATAPTDTVSSTAADQPRHLLLRYASYNVGSDGVERETRHASRMLRTRDSVWTEREWPTALRDSTHHGHDHSGGNAADHRPVAAAAAKPGAGNAALSGVHTAAQTAAQSAKQAGHAGHSHAHDDLQTAPLLLQRNPDGTIDVQSVQHDKRRIIHVDLAHHANVGFGGSWAAAWSLLDPRALNGLTKVGAVKNGVQRYEKREGERETIIDWDVSGQYARQYSVREAHGTSWRTMTATPQPLPAVMPWLKLGGYSQGDYSDLLD